MTKKTASETELRSRRAFYEKIGAAVVAWGRVEMGLAMWFQKLTNTHPVTSRKMFYSGLSLNSKIGMMEDLLDVVSLQPPEIKPFIVALLKKASAYAPTRNNIVHGDTLYVGDSASKYFKKHVIISGRFFWKVDMPEKNVITSQKLDFIIDNFARLAAIAIVSANWDGTPEKSPLGYLELVRGLPNPPQDGLTPSKLAIQFQQLNLTPHDLGVPH